MNQHVGKSNSIIKLTVIALSLLFSLQSFAQSTENQQIVFEGSLTDTSGNPIDLAGAVLTFYVSTSGGCYLYGETSTASSDSQGNIVHRIGSGSQVAGSPNSFTQNIFFGTVTGTTAFAGNNCTAYSTDTRFAQVYYSAQNISATIKIGSVPYAHNATRLNGKSDSDFVANATLTALNCDPATHAITVNNSGSFSCIAVGVTNGGGITGVTTSGTVLTTGGTASAPVIGIQAVTGSQDGYLTSLDYAEFKAKLSASSTQIVNTLGYAPVSGAAVVSQIASSILVGDVSGNPGSNTVDSVGSKSASQISTSVDDTLAATSNATSDTIVKRSSSGNFTANDIYANATKVNYVDIYKPLTSINIRLQAPTSLSTNYVLNLPTTSGTTGQVLSTDGSGNLSWISPAISSVINVNTTAPLASTGGSNPTISITQSSSSTDGYLSSTDWATFNNKQAATSAAIIATLGYVPADNAVSGTYAQKANNLSDLANIATARTNLGLGGFATVSSLDLSTASATGIIADARLQDQSNVTSGTQYTKVTVDGKGRVTSGAQLSSSDVTAALGYTPANNAESGTYAKKANNLSDLADSTEARTNLGLGSLATKSMVALSSDVTGFLPIANGGSQWSNNANGVYTVSNTAIGTTSVQSTIKLYVEADTIGQVVKFNNTNTTGYGLRVDVAGSNPSQYALNVNTGVGSALMVQNNGLIGMGTMLPSARLQIASGSTSVAPLKLTSGTLLSTAQAGAIEYDGANFYLTDNTNSRRTISTLSSTGSMTATSIGINRAPSYALDVNGVARIGDLNQPTNYAFSLQRTGTDTTMEFLNGTNPNTNNGSYLRFNNSDFEVKNLTSNGSIVFYTSAIERMRITSNGNVGIGTLNPEQKLTVDGSIESKAGGYKFPDGTSQTTSAFGGYERIPNTCASIGSCTAMCTSGKKIISGGCQLVTGTATLVSSYPSGDDRWQCNWSASATTSAWTICTKM